MMRFLFETPGAVLFWSVVFSSLMLILLYVFWTFTDIVGVPHD